MSDDVQVIDFRHSREDVPTTPMKRWKYWLFIEHAKFTIILLIVLVVLWAGAFPFAIFVLKWHWASGFLGPLIFIGYILYWIGWAWWFITKRAWPAYFLAIFVYFIISYFIQAERVGLRELGKKNTHFFNITTTADGYLLHEGKMFGLLKKPIYLDKTTVQYFKEHGTERVSKEKGKKDESFLEIDIVPPSWRGDPLLITDKETKKEYINNKILVTQEIRDIYSMVIKGLPPIDQEVERTIIYETILGTADIRQQLIEAKYKLKHVDIERLELVLDVTFPPKAEEYLRIKRVIDKTTEPYDKLADSEEHKREMKEISAASSKEELEKLMEMYYVSEEED